MAITDDEDGTSSILLRRRLANELRRLREAAGLTLEEVATQLGCSAAKLSRIETWEVAATIPDVEAMLARYGVDDEKRGELLTMTRQARRRGPRRRDFRDLPDVFTLRQFENEAEQIRMYHAVAIPGLFQVEGYARSMISVVLPQLDDEETERHVGLRMERQELLHTEQPPNLHVILDEAAIRRLEGTPHVLGEQVQRLVEVAELANVTVQIIPFAVGLYGGLAESFRIFTFPASEDVDLVHLEGLSVETYLHRPGHIAKYSALFDQLRRIALTPEKSTTFLREIELGAGPNLYRAPGA
jgi:transcriptional regulator with XRE-family HTH domain